MRLEYLPLDEIEPDPLNPRRHDRDALLASVSAGLHAPLVCRAEGDRRILVAGHGRRDALLTLRASGRPPPEGVAGWVVPIWVGPWTTAKEGRKALRRDNAASDRASYDFDLLRELQREIDEAVEPVLDAVEVLEVDEDDEPLTIDDEQEPEPVFAITLTFAASDRARILGLFARGLRETKTSTYGSLVMHLLEQVSNHGR